MMQEDYPTLVPVLTWQEKMEKRLAESETRITKTEKEFQIHKGLLFGFCEREIIILAGEILKWSVKKRGENDGEGRQLFDQDKDVKRMLGCRAYGEFGSYPNRRHVKVYKEMSQVVIKARNNTVHFQDLGALERMVQSCETVIKEWPKLGAKYPAQVPFNILWRFEKDCRPLEIYNPVQKLS